MDEAEYRRTLTELGNAQDWPAYFRALRQGQAPKLTRADLELPPPEHTSRDPWPEGFAAPSGIATLRKLAEGAGWEAHVQYARGWKWGVGTNMALVHSVALKLHHVGTARAAVVVYEAKAAAEKLSWTADTVWVMGQDLSAYGGLGVTDLKVYLAEAPGWTAEELGDWVLLRKEEAVVKAERAKAKAKTAPKKAKESAG